MATRQKVIEAFGGVHCPMNATSSGAVYVQTTTAPNEVEPVGSWGGLPATVARIAAS